MKTRATNGEGEWRVICEDGKTHTLEVRHLTGDDARHVGTYVWHADCAEVGGTAIGRTAREAVQSIARMAFWVPLEILGPDGSTPETDWRPLPSCAEALAHNARTGGDCFGPWLCIEDPTDEHATARVVMLCVVSLDTGDEVSADVGADPTRTLAAIYRPVTRRGGALPWPEAN